MPSRNIVFLLPTPFELLDLTGPIEVFHAANDAATSPIKPYAIHLISSKPDSSAVSTAGFKIGPVTDFKNFQGHIHTLLVVGGSGAVSNQDQSLLNWLQERARGSRRVGAICTGAFILAQAGLLDGRRAVTHWKFCNQLAERYPRIRVESDPIYLKDGKIYTSAGVSAGIDLSLAMVEEDLGIKVTSQIARELVLFLRRPGGQKQFSSALAMQQRAFSKELRELPVWALDRLSRQIDVKSMAEASAMSTRTFARKFAEEFQTTPAAWLRAFRVDAACTKLQHGRPLKSVASECGFANLVSMRRAFMANLHIGPGEYQERFLSRCAQEAHGS